VGTKLSKMSHDTTSTTQLKRQSLQHVV